MTHSTLPELDSSLYPQVWQQQTFNEAQTLLNAMLTGLITPDPYGFAKLLQANDIYLEWVNASVFGRYIQRSFAALYNQSEDSFNMDIPALFRNELLRHAQYLPLGQTLFVAGNMPSSARREKLFTTTLNPATVIIGAHKLNQDAHKSKLQNNQRLIVNQIRIASKQVLGFPIRHNKRTSERIRNEILVLGFNDLRLVDEQELSGEIVNQQAAQNSGRAGLSKDTPVTTTILRSYELR